jgi:hypothetical protein
MFTYMRSLYGPRNLQLISVLMGCKSKERRFRTNVHLHFLLVYGHTIYPQIYERQYCITLYISWRGGGGEIRITNTMEQRHYSEASNTNSWSINYPPFMEPEGSLPCSQEPATCPYPEPNESSLHPKTYFPKIQ